jgi:hypothetical protein
MAAWPPPTGSLPAYSPAVDLIAGRDEAAGRFAEEARAGRVVHPGPDARLPAGAPGTGPAHPMSPVHPMSPFRPAAPGSAASVIGLVRRHRDRLAVNGTVELTRQSRLDRALIASAKRRAVMFAAVTADRPDAVRRPGCDPSTQRLIASLHGLFDSGTGLFAQLEETGGRGLPRHFALSTPAAQAARILDAWSELESEAPSAVSVHIYRRGNGGRGRKELALLGGVARLSMDGRTWERSVPEDDWTALFVAAVAQ